MTELDIVSSLCYNAITTRSAPAFDKHKEKGKQMSTVLTCNFSTLFRIIGHVFNENKPCLLRGKHGIGKSEIVYQLAQRLFWDEKNKKTVFIPFDQKPPKDVKLGLSVIERRVSQMTEGDLIGLPVIKGDTTSFNPPDWFKR